MLPKHGEGGELLLGRAPNMVRVVNTSLYVPYAPFGLVRGGSPL